MDDRGRPDDLHADGMLGPAQRVGDRAHPLRVARRGDHLGHLEELVLGGAADPLHHSGVAADVVRGADVAERIGLANRYAIAGLVIWATLSAFWLFLLDGLTFLLAGVLVFGLGNLGGGVKRLGIWTGIGRTWAVVRARSHLLIAGAAAFFISMSFPTLITLAYSLNGGKEGPRTYVILEVMLATGIVVGSIIVGRMRNIGSMRTVAQGLVLTGVLSLGIAVSPYWLVAILLLFASAGNTFSYCRHSPPSVFFQSVFALMP